MDGLPAPQIARRRRRWLPALLLVPLLLAGWWLWPRPLQEAQLRPPAALPVALEASGLARPGWGPLKPIDNMVRRARGVPAGVLASAIRLSASEAIREGAQPMPRAMRDRLAPHYGADVLATIRWTTRGRRIELGSLLTAWVLEEGAVTLDRVIVFDNEELAENLWLWAHELAHVEQYRRLGVEGFAAAYLADWAGMEAEAVARGNAVVAAVRAEEQQALVRWLPRGEQGRMPERPLGASARQTKRTDAAPAGSAERLPQSPALAPRRSE